MRCLYCGKELALLKRWTRGGQFCSEAHQKSYQEEYNRIGLNRLLQAQNKPKAAQQEAAPGANGGGPKTPARPVREAPVAVEEAPMPVEEARIEAVEEVQHVEEVAQPAVAEESEEISAEAADEQAAEDPSEPAWEPESMAGFVHDAIAEPVAFETSPHSDSWQPGEISPVAPRWQPAGVISRHLPEAAVLELKFRPNLAESEHSAPEVKLTPHQFETEKPFPPALARIAVSNQLPSAGVLRLDMKASAVEWSAFEGAVATLAFPPEEMERGWQLLELRSTEIAFPGADAPVFFEGESADGALWEGVAIADAGVKDEAGVDSVEPVEEPLSVTDDLAQLQESLSEGHLEPAPGKREEPVKAAEAEIERVAGEPTAAEAVAEIAEPVTEAPGPVETEPAASPELAPRSADQAVEIPLKIFTPAKPNPMEGEGALIKLPVFLPEHTGLPLRPKMGLVPASGTVSKKSGQRAAATTQPATESKAADAKAESKPVAEPKAATETAKPQATPAAKPWGKPTAPPASKEGGAKKTTVTPRVQPAPSVKITSPASKPREEEKTKQAAAAERAEIEKAETAKAAIETKAAPEKTGGAKAAPEKAIAAKAPIEKAEQKTAPNTKPAEAPTAAADIAAPSFGAAQSSSASFLSTLKGKLAIGGAAVALCLGAYLIFGGKAPAPAPNPAAAADKAGPSIMVGAGGWVEGWAGDPSNAFLGRKITIYRPSLKLSDYRIEFNGEIEHKSIGWVFRATDPQNYYVMKLAYITPGLEPKIGLLKSVVINGKETQVGKTPINMNVRLETQYSVRVDVRGSKFTTYVQGQQVDTWSDDQLKVGGVGFLNEREERGRVKSVSVSLLNGGKQ